ncbi:MAG: hypothetical protein Tsb002_36610 [Wenzhouxiangellaceae bacterium]
MKTEPKVEPWFSDSDTPFEVDDPYYFEPEDYDFEWVKKLEREWTVIRDELHELLRRDAAVIQPYPKQSMVSGKNSWRTLAFMFWSFEFKENIALCPKTWALVKDIPNLTAVSFNMLEEETSIRPHAGDTNTILRCHMGLDVPAGLPRCGFRVGTETRPWVEGKFLMFNDAHEHTAWNNTQGKRFILVIDVMRPQFAHMKTAACSRVLGTINQEVSRENNRWMEWVFGNKPGQFLLFHFFRLTTYAVITSRRWRRRN